MKIPFRNLNEFCKITQVNPTQHLEKKIFNTVTSNMHSIVIWIFGPKNETFLPFLPNFWCSTNEKPKKACTNYCTVVQYWENMYELWYNWKIEYVHTHSPLPSSHCIQLLFSKRGWVGIYSIGQLCQSSYTHIP